MILSEEQFYRKLNRHNGLTNKIIDLDNKTLTIQNSNLGWITFENCIFNCNQLKFNNIKDSSFVLEFNNCSFNCDVSFSNCTFDSLIFKNTKTLKSLKIQKGLSNNNVLELNIFEFSNDPNLEKTELKTNFHISNIEIKDTFSFENINHIEGKFRFLENKLGNKEKNKGQFMFTNSRFTNAYFFRNCFNELTTFYNTTFNYDLEYLKSSNAGYNCTLFHKNTFEKVSFSNSNFINKCDFNQCDFSSTTWFENCKNSTNSHLKFTACEFKGFVLYNHSTLNLLVIDRCTFDKSVSFNSGVFKKFKLFEVKFLGGVYFEKINEKTPNDIIKNWDYDTLRSIKSGLVNSHNQIDYLRFKAYELNAYKKEIDGNKLNRKDSFILYFNEDSNYFGLDWTKGLQFIIKWSFLFYFLHLLTYMLQVKCKYLIPKQEDFYINYMKFANPLSFLNPPLVDSDKYFLPLLFLILGKIFVSYGIYQTIQAFRKFGVNGG